MCSGEELQSVGCVCACVGVYKHAPNPTFASGDRQGEQMQFRSVHRRKKREGERKKLNMGGQLDGRQR